MNWHLCLILAIGMASQVDPPNPISSGQILMNVFLFLLFYPATSWGHGFFSWSLTLGSNLEMDAWCKREGKTDWCYMSGKRMSPTLANQSWPCLIIDLDKGFYTYATCPASVQHSGFHWTMISQIWRRDCKSLRSWIKCVHYINSNIAIPFVFNYPKLGFQN